MCSAETEQLIIEVVTAKVDGDEKFTAFDVSREVQARQEEDGVPMDRHRNIKNDIHREMAQYVDSGIYEKTLHEVGAPSLAFLYHPSGTDPSDYVPQHRQNAPPRQPQAQPQPVQPSQPQGAVGGPMSGQNGHRGDARGTLAVSCDVVREAGFVRGELAYVFPQVRNGQDVLVISKNNPGNFRASYTVDEYENVRITHSTLSVLTDNGPSVDTFDFEVDGTEVVVSKN